MQIISMIISVLGVGGITSGIVLRKITKMELKQEKREKMRVDENILIMRGLQAVGCLAEAAAIAQKRGVPNGETEAALSYYKRFADDMNGFLLQQNAVHNHGRN